GSAIHVPQGGKITGKRGRGLTGTRGGGLTGKRGRGHNSGGRGALRKRDGGGRLRTMRGRAGCPVVCRRRPNSPSCSVSVSPNSNIFAPSSTSVSQPSKSNDVLMTPSLAVLLRRDRESLHDRSLRRRGRCRTARAGR